MQKDGGAEKGTLIGDRTQGHEIKGLALCQLSYEGTVSTGFEQAATRSRCGAEATVPQLVANQLARKDALAQKERKIYNMRGGEVYWCPLVMVRCIGDGECIFYGEVYCLLVMVRYIGEKEEMYW